MSLSWRSMLFWSKTEKGLICYKDKCHQLLFQNKILTLILSQSKKIGYT